MQTPDAIIHDRSREQLSALMDGALSADETRFLLRRLQHDQALAGCWDRWRVAGEAMRGLAPTRRLPDGFAASVARAIAADAAADAVVVSKDADASTVSAPAARGRWLRWGGGAAVAASLAMTFLLVRQPEAVPAADGTAQVATAAPAPVAPVTRQAPAPATQQAQAPLLAAASVAAIATPVRAQRRATTARVAQAARGPEVATTAAPRNELASAPAPVADPFAAPVVEAERPWPRSVLPQADTSLTVGLRSATPASPFAPPPGALLAEDPNP